MVKKVKKIVLLSLAKFISVANTDGDNPFGMQRLFFGIAIFPTIVLIFSTFSENASNAEYFIRISYALCYFVLTLRLIAVIAKMGRNFDSRNYSELSTDQIVFVSIFIIAVYTMLNYGVCVLLIHLFV